MACIIGAISVAREHQMIAWLQCQTIELQHPRENCRWCLFIIGTHRRVQKTRSYRSARDICLCIRSAMIS